jgi:4-carboxymuconolactone decarboxylase
MTDSLAEPRIAPLAPPYDPGTEEMLRKWMPPGAAVEPLALFRTLAIHQDLFARMRPLGAGILGHGRIDPRDREIVIARVCARAGAEYEWGVHASTFGRAVGLSDEQLAASAVGTPQDPAWAANEALLVRMVDELHDGCDVSAQTWSELASRYRDDQLLELVITAGWYRLLSGVINAVRVPLEPWASRFPNR